MLYIMCALKPETQAFVDRYKLSKSKANCRVTLLTTGVGTQNMFRETQAVVQTMKNEDFIINVGICGGSPKYKIGQLVDGLKENLTCVDEAVSKQGSFDLVDMESRGFLDATKDIKNRYIFKVVSDHFEPQHVTKAKTKMLIFNVIEQIEKIIDLKEES